MIILATPELILILKRLKELDLKIVSNLLPFQILDSAEKYYFCLILF